MHKDRRSQRRSTTYDIQPSEPSRSRGAKLLVPNSKSGATSAKWSLAPEMPWHQNSVGVVWHQNSGAMRAVVAGATTFESKYSKSGAHVPLYNGSFFRAPEIPWHRIQWDVLAPRILVLPMASLFSL
ncbi:hypothetical protein Tco_0935666 [Tanacetum coccineum]